MFVKLTRGVLPAFSSRGAAGGRGWVWTEPPDREVLWKSQRLSWGDPAHRKLGPKFVCILAAPGHLPAPH